MKITDIFNKCDRAVLSFEVFPPKKSSPIESVYSKLEEICSLNPDFISVTYAVQEEQAVTAELARSRQK